MRETRVFVVRSAILNLLILAAVYLSRWGSGFYGCKGFQNFVGMRSTFGYYPRVAGLQDYYLTFRVQLSPTANYEANCFVGAAYGFFIVAGLLIFPEAHGYVFAGGKILLAVVAFGRMVRVDFDNGGVRHMSGVLG
jgi:hypothetical protein